MTDPTFRLLAAAAAEIYLLTRKTPRNSPLRLLGPASIRQGRFPVNTKLVKAFEAARKKRLRLAKKKPLALPEHATAA